MEGFTPIKVLLIGGERSDSSWTRAVKTRYYDVYVGGEKIFEVLTIPSYLKELVTGMLVSNGYVEDPSSILGVKISDDRIDVTVTPDYEFRTKMFKEKNRNPLEDVDIGSVTSSFVVPSSKIVEKVAFLSELPTVVISDENGYTTATEDVSLDTAFYKGIGLALENEFDVRYSFILSNGIITPEILIRSAYMGIPVVGTVFNVTDMSVKVADVLGITLFRVTPKGIELFTHPSRIK